MLGFYNIIKPTGVSSGFVVNRIKKLTGQRVGHLGTLDPLAAGVLPVAVGKATRFFDYFLDKDKTYIALGLFGVETDTLDCEGKIVKKIPKHVSLRSVKSEAARLVGKIKQKPPIYSAKSVNGVRAYEAAIKNVDIELEPKEVEIYSIDVEEWHKENVFLFKIHCKSGTYVRSIIRDVAESLGTCATTLAIIRTQSGRFEIDSAVTIDELQKDFESGFMRINTILKMPEVHLDNRQAKDLFSGKEIALDKPDGEYLAYYNNLEFSVVSCCNNVAKNKIYLYEKECL